MYTCTKRYPEICVAHRNWQSQTHCALIHGYARTVEVTISCLSLSSANWVVDLGDLRFIKEFLYEQWDHRLLVASDDPLLDEMRKMEELGLLSLNILDANRGWGPSLEQSCRFILDHIQTRLRDLTQGRCWVSKVEVWEKTDNRASLVVEAPPA